ncbi:uncharacterized protein LOC132708682 [Cylas formicarius]|uniref:uncharacterized protein LOC132708682 n=1 Tax=Cylas formicarius TaxID=197179 RepID=UPI0029586145|nr:uncharacterized protein LOC132708682 [Cylas formicarius]
MYPWSVALFVVWVTSAFCQENAGSNVGPGLMACYNDSAIPGVLTANGRPPATINILIEFIRKLEDANPTISSQQLALQLIQRFRQDGITRTDRPIESQYGIPFAARRAETYKFRVMSTKLLPNVEQTISNGDLNELERCSLHYMISNTIDDRIRDNEASECSRSSRYTSRIIRRRRDVELLNPDGPDLGVLSLPLNGSQCPIELGVVYTQYGTVKAGNVLAGIAAGLNQQNIENGVVDNRFAATITGELCEASLYQASSTVALGASGGWNSTINPRYYFLHNNNQLQATDAEIRGALDGLYMALRVANLQNSDIKISQILDMYYSPYQKGVLDSSFKACNRNILYTEMTSTEMMQNQLLNFMPVLNTAAVSGASLTNASFAIFTQAGITAFQQYLPQINTADLSCTSDSSVITRVATDLLIFIDHGWSYNTVQSILSYILSNIDVSRFGTRYALYSGSDAQNLLFYNTTNRTNYLADFYQKYNLTVHQNASSGFNYITVFESIENIGYDKLNNNTYSGGESTVVLLLPRATMSEDQRNFVSQRRQIMNQYLPDLNIFVLGTGTQNDYDTIVSNPAKDVVVLQDTSNEESLKGFGQQIVNNIKSVPRAVVNPSCTSSYNGPTNTFALIQYVEPSGVNYYRISPNYFYGGGDSRNLKIREEGYGSLTICFSRDNSKPDNSSNSCRSISSSEYNVNVNDYCDGSVSSCSPIYLSVTGGSTNIRCRETACRFPDDIKYTVSMENVGCASGSIIYTASIVLVAVLIFLQRF